MSATASSSSSTGRRVFVPSASSSSSSSSSSAPSPRPSSPVLNVEDMTIPHPFAGQTYAAYFASSKVGANIMIDTGDRYMPAGMASTRQAANTEEADVLIGPQTAKRHSRAAPFAYFKAAAESMLVPHSGPGSMPDIPTEEQGAVITAFTASIEGKEVMKTQASTDQAKQRLACTGAGATAANKSSLALTTAKLDRVKSSIAGLKRESRAADELYTRMTESREARQVHPREWATIQLSHPRRPDGNRMYGLRRCTGRNPDGSNCRDETPLGEYCVAHLASVFGLRIAPSSVPNGGLGLYSLKMILTNDQIDWYTGFLIQAKLLGKHDTYAMDTEDQVPTAEKYCIDASPTCAGIMRMVNDPSGTQFRPNVEAYAESRAALLCYATADIYPGQELFMPYGQKYWDTLDPKGVIKAGWAAASKKPKVDQPMPDQDAFEAAAAAAVRWCAAMQFELENGGRDASADHITPSVREPESTEKMDETVLRRLQKPMSTLPKNIKRRAEAEAARAAAGKPTPVTIRSRTVAGEVQLAGLASGTGRNKQMAMAQVNAELLARALDSAWESLPGNGPEAARSSSSDPHVTEPGARLRREARELACGIRRGEDAAGGVQRAMYDNVTYGNPPVEFTPRDYPSDQMYSAIEAIFRGPDRIPDKSWPVVGLVTKHAPGEELSARTYAELARAGWTGRPAIAPADVAEEEAVDLTGEEDAIAHAPSAAEAAGRFALRTAEAAEAVSAAKVRSSQAKGRAAMAGKRVRSPKTPPLLLSPVIRMRYENLQERLRASEKDRDDNQQALDDFVAMRKSEQLAEAEDDARRMENEYQVTLAEFNDRYEKDVKAMQRRIRTEQQTNDVTRLEDFDAFKAAMLLARDSAGTIADAVEDQAARAEKRRTAEDALSLQQLQDESARRTMTARLREDIRTASTARAMLMEEEQYRIMTAERRVQAERRLAKETEEADKQTVRDLVARREGQIEEADAQQREVMRAEEEAARVGRQGLEDDRRAATLEATTLLVRQNVLQARRLKFEEMDADKRYRAFEQQLAAESDAMVLGGDTPPRTPVRSASSSSFPATITRPDPSRSRGPDNASTAVEALSDAVAMFLHDGAVRTPSQTALAGVPQADRMSLMAASFTTPVSSRAMEDAETALRNDDLVQVVQAAVGATVAVEVAHRLEDALDTPDARSDRTELAVIRMGREAEARERDRPTEAEQRDSVEEMGGVHGEDEDGNVEQGQDLSGQDDGDVGRTQTGEAQAQQQL